MSTETEEVSYSGSATVRTSHRNILNQISPQWTAKSENYLGKDDTLNSRDPWPQIDRSRVFNYLPSPWSVGIGKITRPKTLYRHFVQDRWEERGSFTFDRLRAAFSWTLTLHKMRIPPLFFSGEEDIYIGLCPCFSQLLWIPSGDRSF